MDSKFHGLPPLKRFIFMQQEEQQQDRDTAASSSRLPAKKRKESRDPPLFFHEPIATTGVVTTYGLPAKKRVSISMSNSSKVWLSRKLEIKRNVVVMSMMMGL
ncbi:hypothetical protein CJ030_MR2G009171 [Morella rubra]|uniref:Uncharacterized protein n=1 Tax=Morella rubra TaxID=262757 RepID=A0A6A1WE80_9ROSI|nr:hypothetical protein CJ030_MR2G009171 [Morella rubra]